MPELCGIELEHPVINASGTFDAIAARRVYGDALLEDFPFSAFVSKTITPEPRVGNEPQRIWETPAGMINSIGLPNKGLEGFLAEDLPQLAELPVPLIVSVMATSREEFARLVDGVGGREEVAAIELNVSCPNVHSGLIVGEQPAETAALLEAMRPRTEKPLIVKLTPNVTDPAAVALGAEEGGADAVSLINTLKASAIDPLSGRPGIAAGHGGLSGPAVRPIAVAQVRAVCAAVGIPAIGMGGVASGADALEFLSAGARIVAVGTESFRDPLAGRRVVDELAESSPHAPSSFRYSTSTRGLGEFDGKWQKCPCTWSGRGYTRRPMSAPVKTSVAAPERSLDQRMDALKRANDIRTARAKLKKDLKAGKASIHALLLDPPDYVMTAKVFDMLLAVPKYGRVKANRILNQCRISPSKTIGGLSERQRTELVSLLRR